MKGAIFDMDGTLADSMSAWDNVATKYLRSLGIEPQADIEEVIRPLSFADVCRLFIEKYSLDKTVPQVIEEISAMVADKYRYEISLKEGAKEYVEGLKADGVKICVVTASERGYVSDCLKRTGIFSHLDFIMTCTEEGIDKNTAEIYDRARKKLGTTLEETMIYEDAVHAIQAAKAGGYSVTAIYDATMAEHIGVIKASCDRYITSFKELL